MLSKEGQKTLVQKGGFIPVRNDVSPPKGAPSINVLLNNEADMEWLKNDEYINELRTTFQNMILFH